MTPQEAKTEGSSLIQIIRPPEEPGGTIPLEIWDCTNGWNSCGFDSISGLIAAIGNHVATPFDTEVEMVRSLLVKLPSEIGVPNTHLMMISIHHAIMDGGSHPIILRDLLTAYNAYASGAEEPTGLPHLPVEYADYAVWQWHHIEMGGHLEQQLDYWTKQLANTPEPLNLPFDRPRSETSSGREGTQLNVFLPGKPVAALTDLCAQHHSSLSVGLMAAFQLALSRLAGNVQDLVVGTPYAGRDNVQLHEMVGCIMQMLPIRGDLKGNPSFSTLLKRQGLVVADALQHGNVPLHRIMQCLQVPRVSNCNPVYQVVLNYVDDTDNFHVELADMSSSDLEFMSSLELDIMQQVEELSALELKHITLPEQKMTRAYETMNKATEGLSPLQNQDVNLTLYRPTDIKILQADGLRGIMAYNSKLFDRSTAVMMFECFENLLVMAVENPHKVVWYLPMLTQSEEQRQLVEWNKTSSPYPRPGWLLHELFLDQAKENPDGIALIEYGGLKRIISYSELESMAEKVARQMRALGIEGDSTVGLLMTNDMAETIAATYGILMAGGAYVPLDPSYPDERIKLIADDAELRALLVKDEDAFAKHGSLVGCPVLSVAKILDDALLPESSAVNWCPPTPNTSCYIIYTSGTTGKPKGVVLEHRNLSLFLQHGTLCLFKDLGLGSRFLNSSPITFDISSGIQFSTLSLGATLVLSPKSALLDELELLINSLYITHLYLTPSLFHLVVKCDLPTLVCITLGGELVPQHQLDMW